MLSLCSILIENVSNLVIFTGIRFITGGLISSFESCAFSIIRYYFPKSYRTTAYEFIPASFYMPFLINVINLIFIHRKQFAIF